MATLTEPKIKRQFNVKLDTKSRVTIRGAQSEYYEITEYDNGKLVLEPRVLVDPELLKHIDIAVKDYKKGDKGTPLDWSKYPEI